MITGGQPPVIMQLWRGGARGKVMSTR
jgi:hypothetical protein